jgi:signal peptidase
MPRRLDHLRVGLAAVATTVVMTTLALTLVVEARLQIVMTGSMAPSIPVGALIVTVPLHGEAVPGDVILFPHPWRHATVVHRMVAVEHGAIDSDYITKGDANDQEDGWRTPVASATGRVTATVPYLGYVLAVVGLPVVRLSVGLLVLASVLLTLVAARRPGRATQATAVASVRVGEQRTIVMARQRP